MKRIVALVLLAGLLAPACAEVGAKQIAGFLESRDYWAKSMYAERSEFYHALTSAPDNAKVQAAAATLAAKWRIPVSVARDIIEATVAADDVGFGEDAERRLGRIADQFRSAMKAAPESPEVWAMGVHFWADQGHCGNRKLRDEYLSKSFAQSHYLALGECENWVPAFVRRYPSGAIARHALADYLADRDSAAATAAGRWALEAPAAKAAAPRELELLLVRSYWNMLGRAGLGSLLLKEGERAGADVLDRTLHEEVSGVTGTPLDDQVAPREARDLRGLARNQWLAALVDANRHDEAAAEIARRPKSEQTAGYLTDALAGGVKGDIYERYVGDGREGLLWNAELDGVTTSRVTARLLAAGHMETSADLLRESLCSRYQDRDGWADIEAELAALPESFQSHWAVHKQAVIEARRADGCTAANALQPAMSSQLPRHAEIPLTAQQKSAKVRAPYAGKIPLPASFELIRAERDGAEIRAVCLSPAVDPGGEVSPGGFWLVRSRDAGASWDTPYYLGFQAQGPYVVPAEARLSLFAPGVLRLEAEVAELDPESITFPPVMLSVRREAKDLYIDIPLEAIERDSDADGLTDLLEAKLMTDPANTDTDGDGLADRFDDFPQASARAEPHELAPIVVDVLRRVMGYERAGIIEPVRRKGDKHELLSGLKRANAGSMLFRFVAGDIRYFAGLRIDGQVIVLNDEQIAGIRARSGPFYPLSFPAILVDPQRTRAFVQWSAGWTGGNIIYTLKNGRWVGEDAGQWITRAPPVISAPRISPG